MKFLKSANRSLACLALATIGCGSELRIDREASFFQVEVEASPPPHEFEAVPQDYEASVELDQTGEVASATFRFRVADLETGIGRRDAKMRDWLEAERYPEARFELLRTRRENGQRVGVGQVWLRGEVQEVEVPYELDRSGDRVTLSGNATIDYRAWGLEVISLLFIKVDPKLDARFRLVGSVDSSVSPSGPEAGPGGSARN